MTALDSLSGMAMVDNAGGLAVTCRVIRSVEYTTVGWSSDNMRRARNSTNVAQAAPSALPIPPQAHIYEIEATVVLDGVRFSDADRYAERCADRRSL